MAFHVLRLILIILLIGKTQSDQTKRISSKPLTIIVDGIEKHIELAGDKNADYHTVHQFCIKHELSQISCLELKTFVKNKQISYELPNEVKTDNTVPDVDDIEKVKTFKEISSHDVVDYSQKVGQELVVSHEGGFYKLQTYHNESPLQAIKRFCLQLKLKFEDCEVVKTKFLILSGLLEESPPPPLNNNNNGEINNNNENLIDIEIWNMYLYPIMKSFGVVLIIFVYLQQWRDDVQAAQNIN